MIRVCPMRGGITMRRLLLLADPIPRIIHELLAWWRIRPTENWNTISHVMDVSLFGTKPLPKPAPSVWQLNPREQPSVKF